MIKLNDTSRHSTAFLLVIYFLLASTHSNAQQEMATIKGRAIDSITASGLTFCGVSVINSSTNKLSNESVTAQDGSFTLQLSYGTYYVQVDFMGYKPARTTSFTLSKDHKVHDIGLLKLALAANTLQDVTVQAERSSMQLSLDKKVFTVGKDLANAGGSASDILTNIPSVSVDPEGNVKLRGSGNVRMLIDGKPSGLVSFKGGSGLQQLQASLIDRVEIITNPSARYEAEGMAGIINIILKKDNRQGFNGSFEATTGYPTNLGAAANINYRHKKLNFFINYGIAYRMQPGEGKLYQEVYRNDSTFILQQNNIGKITGFNNNIRGGLDYYFNDKSIVTAAYLYRKSNAGRISNFTYRDYVKSINSLTGISTRMQDENEVEPNSEYTVNYKRTFARKGHELLAEVKYLDNWESSQQVYTQQFYNTNGQEDKTKAILQHSPNDEYEKQYLFQLDYVQPIGEEGKIEMGVRSSIRNMENDFLVTERNAAGVDVALPGLDNDFLYDENIHAAYGIVGNKSKRISYQAGLRAEWTDVTTRLVDTKEVNPRKYSNLFPSAHFTVDLGRQNAMQLSYSRRVRRPVYNDLSPYMTFSDSRNFFSGNPDLDPEFSNSFELGHILTFEKGSVSSALYYRDTKGKIERIRVVKADGNSSTRPENLLREKAFGVEFTSAYIPYKWWKLDANFNFFHADIDGSNIISTYKTTTYSWFARQTSRFTVAKHFDLQLRGNYEARQKTAQGIRKALYYFDVSMSKDVFKGNGTLNLNVLDVFNSRRNRYITRGSNFYTEGNFLQRRRQINLTLNYRIKQSKTAKKVITTEQ